jgi:hypothetical protein
LNRYLTLANRLAARNPSGRRQHGEYHATRRCRESHRCETPPLPRVIPVTQFIEADAEQRRNNL